MPYSSTLLDKDFSAALGNMTVRTHLDIGAGAGKYGRMVAQEHPESVRTAIEIWPPYVEQFRLRTIYQDVRVMPVADLMDDPDQAWDLVTAGDVLEHLPKSRALDLIEWLIYRSQVIWVQVPLRYPQNSVNGNRFEAHVSIWDARDFARFEHTSIQRGDMLGVWIWGWKTE